MTQELDLTQHPCFNEAARKTAARIHLPVAPRCNVQCNFCDRRFDCLNESRPGVTSAVLTPQQALHYLELAMEKSPAIRVAGIAGPGDPFASPEDTLETLRVEGNIATLLTKRRALGFSAFTAKWVGVDRAFPGRR